MFTALSAFLTQTTLGVMLISFLIKFILAIGSWIALKLVLRDLDNAHGFDFNTWIASDKTSDLAKGIYYAGRILAMAVLIGWIIA